jgi:hypothetical protein
MNSRCRWLGILALAGALFSGGAAAQELDGRVKVDPAGRPCVLRDDSDGSSNEVGKLRSGDEVTVYLQISSDNYYFVKKKSSPPGQDSGWVPRSRVRVDEVPAKAALPAAAATTPAPPAVAAQAKAAPAAAPEWDIPKGHWARSAIEDLAQAGLLRVPDGRFEGDKMVSRYEMAVLTQRTYAKTRETAEELKTQVRKVSETGDATRQQVGKLASRMNEVETKLGKLAEKAARPAQMAAAPANAKEIQLLTREVSNLRQTFTRSIAGLALDRSKIDEYRAAWTGVVTRLEQLEKKTVPRG